MAKIARPPWDIILKTDHNLARKLILTYIYVWYCVYIELNLFDMVCARRCRCNGGSYRIHIGIRCDKYSIVTARTEYWQVFEHYQQEKDSNLMRRENIVIVKSLNFRDWETRILNRDIFILVFHWVSLPKPKVENFLHGIVPIRHYCFLKSQKKLPTSWRI